MTLKGQLIIVLSILLGVTYSIVAGKYKNNRILCFFIGVSTYWVPLLSFIFIVDCLIKNFSNYYIYSSVDLYVSIIEIISVIVSIIILYCLSVKWKRTTIS